MSTITGLVGALLSLRAVSTPSIPGMRRSSSTRSGSSRSTAATPSWPDTASPASSKPGAAAITTSAARLKTAWSSTVTTRTATDSHHSPVLRVSELHEPAAELAMHGFGAHELLSRYRQVLGMQEEGERLRPPHSAVGAHQLLERRHLVRLLPERAVDHEVGAVGEAVGTPDVACRGGSERGKRILALDLSLPEEVHSRVSDHRGAGLPRPDEHEADARVTGE